MRTVQLIEAEAPLAEVEIDAAEPGPGEVKVRIEAAGICHSDVHYRSGLRRLDSLPVVLGHEIAGTIEAAGPGVGDEVVGSRVALHYVISCGACRRCRSFGEQFCENYEMLGVTVGGGFAEAATVPSENAIPIPDSVPTAHAAVMMCSTATALHALHRSRLEQGDTVAVFGAGGLGMSAIQLAIALGAGAVVAIDIDESRLAVAADLGAQPVLASHATEGLAELGGADVALDLVGSFEVLRTAIDAAPPGGRVVVVGLTDGEMPIDPFADMIRREVELIGSNDHLANEIHELFAIADSGGLSLDQVVTGEVPLEADAINEVMDVMERYGPGIRTVVAP